MCSLTALEIRSLKSRYRQGQLPSKSSPSLPLPASGNFWHSLACGSNTPTFASIFMPPSCLCAYLCLNLPLLSLIKTQIIGFRSHPNPVWSPLNQLHPQKPYSRIRSPSEVQDKHEFSGDTVRPSTGESSQKKKKKVSFSQSYCLGNWLFEASKTIRIFVCQYSVSFTKSPFWTESVFRVGAGEERSACRHSFVKDLILSVTEGKYTFPLRFSCLKFWNIFFVLSSREFFWSYHYTQSLDFRFSMSHPTLYSSS